MIAAIIISAAVVLLALSWLTLEYSFLVPAKKGLPILMYHKISSGVADGLSVPQATFERQLVFLREKGYNTITFAELSKALDSGEKLPSRPVILTFDDAYADFAERALPLLKRFDFKATVFIPVAYLGKTNVWDNGTDQIMTAEQVKAISQNENVEFGLHSFLHRSYGELNLEDMQEDLINCTQTLAFYKIPFVHVLAYPYGSYPKKDKLMNAQMKELFRETGLKYALRIGNRINPLPIKEPFEMKRIDIRGTDNFTTFKTKLRKGRKKLFS